MGNDSYGVWVTLTSVITWITLFDLGVGNTLKNAVATKNGMDINREYSMVMSISTYMSLLMLIIMIICASFFSKLEVNIAIIFALYIPIILFFPLKNFSYALQGLRLVGVNSIIESLRIVLWLTFVYIYFLNWNYNYETLVFLFVISNIVPSLVQFFVFRLKYEKRLKFKLIPPKEILYSNTLKLGLRFFIIQLSSILLFSIGNIMIASNFSISNVAMYDTYNKIFISGLSVFNMIIAVAWPEFSYLHSKGNANECMRLYKYLIILAGIFSIGVFMVCMAFERIMFVLGLLDNIDISKPLIYIMGTTICIQAFSYCGAVYLNATNVLNYQIILSLIGIVLIFPTFYLFKFIGLELLSYPLSTAIIVSISLIACNFKAIKEIKRLNVYK